MSSAVAVLSGLVAVVSVGPAFAQGAGGGKAAHPAGKAAPAAQHADAQKPGDAKALLKEANASFDKGDCASALPLYRQADAITPSAEPRYKIALCVDKGGQVADAVAAWQAFLDAPPHADKVKDKITEAERRLEELKKTPAKVKLVAAPESASNLKIVVDNVQQPSKELSLAPGQHKLTITADGFAPATQDLSVSYAETRDVNVQLTPAAPPAKSPATEVSTQPAAPPAAPPAKVSEPSSPVPGYVAIGLAGAGAIAGSVFGILSLGAKSDFDDDPTSDNADKVDDITRAADIAFVAAIGFGVAGTVLLLNSRDPEPPKASAHETRRLVVAPYAGPTGGGAAARFTF